MATHENTIDLNLEDETAYEPVNQTKLALNDVIEGLRNWPIWLMLAYQDIKLRYRRSVLGPFWLTISMAITIYTMGFIYSHIFHTQMSSYFPFLAAGMLTWTMLSSIVTEFTDGFTTSEHLIKQIKLPYTLYIHRIASRNILIFFHNIVVIVPIMIFYHETTRINFNLLLLIPGLALIYINAVSYGLILAMIGARFRDMGQIIRSLVQVVFFVTPVMWKPDDLKGRIQMIIAANPFYSLIELIRAPLLGNMPTLHNVTYALTMTLVGIMGAWMIFVRRRSRIVYWL